MKANETQLYKGIGTITQSKNEDGERCYIYTHFFSGKSYEEDTIKGAKEMLDWEEKQAQEVRAAIAVLSRYNYKVYKEVN
jgi:hypothetical protein